jgi:hypothetical protein
VFYDVNGTRVIGSGPPPPTTAHSLPRRDQELLLPALFDELRRDHHATLTTPADA